MRTFMRDMLDLDLSGWKASDIPNTAAKTAQIGLSLHGLDKWLWELAEDDAPAPWSWMNAAGVDLSLGGGATEGWLDAGSDGYAAKHQVYEAYRDWAQSHPKERYELLGRTHFWRRMRSLAGVAYDYTGIPVACAPNGTGLTFRRLQRPSRDLVGFPTRDKLNETLRTMLKLG
jgi:hypothetical protein